MDLGSLHSMIAAAAEKAEPDKTPFYIGGGLLAAWAVIVSAIGLSRPDFPRSPGLARVVMLISVVLVAGAMISGAALS